MEKEHFNADEWKENWISSGFTGGAVICCFMKMQELGLDLVFDKQEDTVREYTRLLEQRLETTDRQLVLMADAEITRCFVEFPWDDHEYEYLLDEIHDHYRKTEEQYPETLVGLHIDIIVALYVMLRGEVHYVMELQLEYAELWGEDSYLFCRNYCCIIREFFAVYYPDIAIKEFESYQDKFHKRLYDSALFYLTYMTIADLKVKDNDDVEELRKAIVTCEEWLKDVSQMVQEVLRPVLKAMLAMYYRYTGRLKESITGFLQTIQMVPAPEAKLYFLDQAISMLYLQRQFESIKVCIETGQKWLKQADLYTSDAAVEFLNLNGLYELETGSNQKAQGYFEKAIEFSTFQSGENSDQTLKYRSNLILAKYQNWEMIQEMVQELMETMARSPALYPDSYSVMKNNLVVFQPAVQISSVEIMGQKRILRNYKNPHDEAGTVLYKSNLFFLKLLFDGTYAESEVELDLNEYFKKNPGGFGYVQYLKGKILKFAYLHREKRVHEMLRVLNHQYAMQKMVVGDGEEIFGYYLSIRLALYEEDYGKARKLLVDIWEKKLVKLFSMLANGDFQNEERLAISMNLYLSILISVSLQEEKVGIAAAELWNIVSNYKYLWDLESKEPQKFAEIVSGRCTLEWHAAFEDDCILLDMIGYTRIDLSDVKTLVCAGGGPELLYQLCFIVEQKKAENECYDVQVIYDLQYSQMIDIWFEDTKTVKQQRTMRNLSRKLVGKEKIYVCMDLLEFLVPAGSVELDNGDCAMDRCQVFYITNIENAGRDIEFSDQELRESIFCGKSVFQEMEPQAKSNLEDYLVSLPYIETEVMYLAGLTGGRGWCDKEFPMEELRRPGERIVHLASHTKESMQSGERGLVIIGADGEERLLSGTDIGQMDWKDVKLAVFSGCGTGIMENGSSLRQGAAAAGAKASISTIDEVGEGESLFFFVCFYKQLLKYRKVGLAFSMAQRTMNKITKSEIIADRDYRNIGMVEYLQNYEADECPFAYEGIAYVLQLNEK